MTVVELARRLRYGELSPIEAVTAAFDRIRALDEALNAFISLREEEALQEAEAAARAPERGPLWGVPLAVKDVLDVAGSVTTAGSRILAGNVAARTRRRWRGCVAPARSSSARRTRTSLPTARRRQAPTTAARATRGRS